MNKLEIRTVEVLRYMQPLREGGSLPAIVEADDGFLYVLKFRGAGQGTKALIAELIGGELARAMGLKVPEIVFMNLNDSFGMTEGDEEIQDLLKFSVGLNLGLHYLSGSITYDPLLSIADPLSASKVVLLDSIITNIDRTVKNTNLLNWNRELWLIDHGASLYFHHNWNQWDAHINRPFGMIKDHVLLPKATKIDLAATEIKDSITEEVIKDIIENIPDDWLADKGTEMAPIEMKQAYQRFVSDRVKDIDQIAQFAKDAR
ncbi:MAG: hypothetical protein ACI9FN_002538 [Saprospiraceae bacterium]|jgi:hypothetical protein